MAIAMAKIGDWYRKAGGELFEIVAIDEADGTIEIQDFDGTVEEVEIETWADMRCRPADPPEDYSGSLDIESEDYITKRDVAGRNNWVDPLEFLDTTE
jgi:hypothetical protein